MRLRARNLKPSCNYSAKQGIPNGIPFFILQLRAAALLYLCTMGATEIIFIFVIYLLLFGAKGIPSLAQTMGKAVRQFREASSDIQREILNTGREIQNEVNRSTASNDERKTQAKEETPPNPPEQ